MQVELCVSPGHILLALLTRVLPLAAFSESAHPPMHCRFPLGLVRGCRFGGVYRRQQSAVERAQLGALAARWLQQFRRVVMGEQIGALVMRHGLQRSTLCACVAYLSLLVSSAFTLNFHSKCSSR